MYMANPMLLIEKSKTDPDVKLIMEAMTQGFDPSQFAGMDATGGMETEPDFEKPTPPQPPKYTPPQPEPKSLSPGEALKEKGNKEFKSRNFNKAIEFFDQAIEIEPH